MAKRRRLKAPDQTKLDEIEEGFAAKPILETKSMAPIAQVAGEAAMIADGADRRDAVALRAAKADGLLVEEIDIKIVRADFINRDRVTLEPAEMAELKSSLKTHGQRTPIEVVPLEDGYGLISGYRRLQALSELGAVRVKAFVREAKGAGDAYIDMVEENEIRSNLSHYERGRIVAVAVAQGVFATIEHAVNELFAAASKAKRSKIRSFAALHDALGDILRFPTELSERQGLALAKAAMEGQIPKLRKALEKADPQSVEAEYSAVMGAVSSLKPIEQSKGGRPSNKEILPEVKLKSGGVVSGSLHRRGFQLELKGRVVNKDTAENIMRQIERLLG